MRAEWRSGPARQVPTRSTTVHCGTLIPGASPLRAPPRTGLGPVVLRQVLATFGRVVVDVTPLGALGASAVLFLLGWLGNLALNRSKETRDGHARLQQASEQLRERLARVEAELDLWRPLFRDLRKKYKETEPEVRDEA